jgi:hypothetical protein
MKIIRASELGTYLFCQRAWWYQINGYESENITELAGGVELHKKHSRAVRLGGCLQTIAYTALLLAILTAIVWIIQTRF